MELIFQTTIKCFVYVDTVLSPVHEIEGECYTLLPS
jgi:hypothetical protein